MSAGYYPPKNKSLKKRLVKGIKIFFKKSKTESVHMLVSDMKIFQYGS